MLFRSVQINIIYNMKSQDLATWQEFAHILERVVANIELNSPPSSNQPNPLSLCFECISAPSINLYDYIGRIHEYANCSDSCFALAFIYIDRILHGNPNFMLNVRKIHRLVLTAVVVAIKYLDDAYASNLSYAKLGGVSLDELNTLEIAFLSLLKFNVSVDPRKFYQYRQELTLQYQKITELKVQEEENMDMDSCMESLKTMNKQKTISCDTNAIDF